MTAVKFSGREVAEDPSPSVELAGDPSGRGGSPNTPFASPSRPDAISGQPFDFRGDGPPAPRKASTSMPSLQGGPARPSTAAVEHGPRDGSSPYLSEGRAGRLPTEDGRSGGEAPAWGNPEETGPSSTDQEGRVERPSAVLVDRRGHVCRDGICCGCGDIGADDVGLCLTETTGALRNHGFHSKACFVGWVRRELIEAGS